MARSKRAKKNVSTDEEEFQNEEFEETRPISNKEKESRIEISNAEDEDIFDEIIEEKPKKREKFFS